WPEIRNEFQLDAVLTVVDTPQLIEGALDAGKPIPGASSGGEVPNHTNSVEQILNEQLENADVVILNKIDDLSESNLEIAEALVRKKAPKVRFLELAYHAELDTRLCLGLQLHDEEEAGHHGHGHSHGHHHHGPVHSVPVVDKPLENQAQFDGHAHSGLNKHEHGEHSHEHFHEHDTGWQSFVLSSHKPQDAEKLKAAVKEVTLREPILRTKGFASIAGQHHPLVLQAVRSRVQTYFDDDHRHDTDSRIVFIGYHPNRDRATQVMNELTQGGWH
ncbi:MAG: GTP-binding protein, partial [Verrucomicrobiota bacterium]